MLRIIVAGISFLLGICILYALIKYNKNLKNVQNSENIDKKLLYNINVITGCFGLLLILLSIIFFNQ